VHRALPAGFPEAAAPSGRSAEIEDLERRLQVEAAMYAGLRSRKAVRAALWAAELRHSLRRSILKTR
jgi:hypothetical protein